MKIIPFIKKPKTHFIVFTEYQQITFLIILKMIINFIKLKMIKFILIHYLF